MKMRLFFFLLLLNCRFIYAQDVHLSQFYETPLLRNPALAGIYTGDIRIQAVYRNQWQSVGYPYQTSALSAEYKFRVGSGNDFMTAGMQAFYDIAGSSRLKTTQVMPAINFHKSLNDEKNRYLSVGFMMGFVQRSFDSRYLTFDNQYNNGRFNSNAPSGENFTSVRRIIPDFGAGISYNSSIGEYGNYYLGGALYHFNKPNEYFLQQSFSLKPKLSFNGGLRMPLNEMVMLHMEANYLSQGKYAETIFGGIASYNFTGNYPGEEKTIKALAMGAGIFMRMNDAIVPVIKLNYNNIEIGGSYDINISKLRTASNTRGGYELSLAYKAFLNNRTLQSLICPKF
ncbi:MAG: PorP/SprF family type IX secretion system membrane protein [Chitinophagaceae bacterium]|nr:PorP/SprF family type IX secretion system membrane protein [Chitinophagaceae bacterium]